MESSISFCQGAFTYNGKIMLLLVVLLVCAASLYAQTESQLSPQVLLLSKIQSRMVLNLHRQPNYTCIESIERARRSSPAHKFELLDTLRLEVALVYGKEMFGWPGGKSFEDTDLTQIVSDGAFGNGNFANHARAIFEGGSTHFDNRGEAVLDGRAALRFDYQIPALGSGYVLRVGDRQATVAYHGSIYADPETFDVKRIEVEADEIPPELRLAGATDRMDYARVPIGRGDFLLPESSELSMRDASGRENRNTVRFASCREFSGQSVLSFTDAANIKEIAPVSKIELPADLEISLSLMSDLDTHTAAVGDPVTARLENDLKQKGRVLFLKGAAAHGRITRLDRQDGYTMVGLDFSGLESEGASARLKLHLEQVAGSEFLNPEPRHTPAPAARPGEGIIPLGSGRFRLNRGILTFWRTDP
jgi:hypothetical protein